RRRNPVLPMAAWLPDLRMEPAPFGICRGGAMPAWSRPFFIELAAAAGADTRGRHDRQSDEEEDARIGAAAGERIRQDAGEGRIPDAGDDAFGFRIHPGAE